ncbi:histidinol-phosphatase HisJ family protein [Virgibacillus sp. W0430]|uniref:histidinol-phosphatase HisJ family protein n=1 Tax=Virgibacillus sp. W0430 TaxID=3391580 RepID=UPI003F44D06B
MFDYHMHSDFSADCSTPMESTIEQAIKLGIQEICFTEHIDYEYPDPTIRFTFNLDAYANKIKEMQERYKGQIIIKKGVEIGVQPHILDQYESLLQKEFFDFVICSMHTCDKKELHYGTYFKDRSADEAYRIYYEELLYCVNNYKQYSILGHLDLVKRYKKIDSAKNFHDIIREIFRVIIADGKGIEVNTSGYRYGLDGAMPSIDILKLYKECGGEIITLGSDSHVPSTLAYRFTDTLDLLKKIGFKYIATFEKQQPVFHSIDGLINKKRR